MLKRGRAEAVEAGDPNPDVEQCIAAGLLAAARLDPLDFAHLSEAEALGLVRMALFEAGPAPGIDETVKQAVTERLLEAIEHHGGDDTEAFRRWFFESRDDLVHRIAKQKKRGGPMSREIVRQALLELVWDAYRYVGDCVCLQMQAFLLALPAPLGAGERALFEALYFKQPYFGGLPLILLRDRFSFLKGAMLDILDAPGEPGPIGVLLRLMQYYEEMASARRDVDRAYKRRRHRRDTQGRVARTFPLEVEPPDKRTGAADDLFQKIAARLLEEREVPRARTAIGSCRASLLADGADDGVLVIGVEWDGCERPELIEVPLREFERVAREINGPALPRSRGGPGIATDG